MKTYRTYIIFAILIIFSGLGWWFFNSFGEFEKPEIKLADEFVAIGQRTTMNVVFTDSKSGLSHGHISISQDNNTRLISSINFMGGNTKQRSVPVVVDPVALKLHDGPAVMIITATDQSLWKNSASINKVISVDVIPPQIFLLTPTNHINPGGTCMVVYRTSKQVLTTGIRVENEFFPAYPTNISGKPCYIAYFALPIDTSSSGGGI
ncbi:MAG: hypothetical protein PHN75_03240, partial [Syntrophales bacterium]|nr:hypothetical protein [Syntrophales bacterium]